MHLQLYYLNLRERGNDKFPQSGEYSIRAQQCAIFDGQLDALQERLSAYHKTGFKLRTTASYLASVLSTSYDHNGDALSSSPKNTPGRAHRMLSAGSSTLGLQGNVTQLSNSIGLLLGTSHSKEIPKAELCDRFKTLLIKCVDFLINTGKILLLNLIF